MWFVLSTKFPNFNSQIIAHLRMRFPLFINVWNRHAISCHDSKIFCTRTYCSFLFTLSNIFGTKHAVNASKLCKSFHRRHHLLLVLRQHPFVVLSRVLTCFSISTYNCQKQPPEGVLGKRCSENMQQIYRRTPMPKCDFNKVSKQLYWNHTSGWVFSCKFAVMFQNTFY